MNAESLAEKHGSMPSLNKVIASFFEIDKVCLMHASNCHKGEIMTTQEDTYEGGCTCGQVRYKINSSPLIVHCCHCRWCQRQTGTVFALNALFEANHVELIGGEVSEIVVPSPSGKGQKIARCPKCQFAVWSNYYMGSIKDLIRFIRVGTLDNPDRLPPDIHIFTISKQPWITLPPDDLVVDEFYDYEKVWTKGNVQRREFFLKSATKEAFYAVFVKSGSG